MLHISLLQAESTQSFKDAVSPIAQQCMAEVGATDGKRTINRLYFSINTTIDTQILYC